MHPTVCSRTIILVLFHSSKQVDWETKNVWRGKLKDVWWGKRCSAIFDTIDELLRTKMTQIWSILTRKKYKTYPSKAQNISANLWSNSLIFGYVVLEGYSECVLEEIFDRSLSLSRNWIQIWPNFELKFKLNKGEIQKSDSTEYSLHPSRTSYSKIMTFCLKLAKKFWAYGGYVFIWKM